MQYVIDTVRHEQMQDSWAGKQVQAQRATSEVLAANKSPPFPAGGIAPVQIVKPNPAHLGFSSPPTFIQPQPIFQPQFIHQQSFPTFASAPQYPIYNHPIFASPPIVPTIANPIAEPECHKSKYKTLQTQYQERITIDGHPDAIRTINYESKVSNDGKSPEDQDKNRKISSTILRKMFDRFAKDGFIEFDKFIELVGEMHEFEKKKKPSYQECLALMSKFDVNEDGRIDFDEFSVLINHI